MGWSNSRRLRPRGQSVTLEVLCRGVERYRNDCSLAVGLDLDAGAELLSERLHELMPNTCSLYRALHSDAVILHRKA